MSVVSQVPPFHPVADSLALAMAASSNAPVLLLDGELRVVAASDIFCQTFEIDVSRVTGRRLAELGDGEWGGRQIEMLLKATASGSAEIDAYEMDLNRPSRETHHLVLHARKLAYGDEANVRLLLSITDVTQVRANERLKDDLLREKAVLLRELQHRIANSLQIIASVLLQSARRVTSEETRGHLTDAHQRVMSVATMQRQLARTTLGEVELRPYLTELCQSISASMIRDTERMSLSVASDNARTSSDESISLGLIVTELVINSLKHAFPDGRPGRVSVDYRAQGNAWTLRVSDDGVGMRPDRHARAGLGTSIVEALAKQLKATITVADAQPGVRVSIAHDGVASQEENMAKEPTEFAASSNGDRWFLGRDEISGDDFVEHRANGPSGGAISRTSVAAFLAGRPLGPEHQALQLLLNKGLDD